MSQPHGPGQHQRTVAITGATGFIGPHIVRHLRRRGDEVRILTRSAGEPGEIEWDPGQGTIPSDALDGVDAIINLAGAGLGDKRWTQDYKSTILASRVDSTFLLIQTLARAVEAGRTRTDVRWLQGSAVGYYGDRGDEVLTESSARGEGFLAEVCEAWEASAEGAQELGAKVSYLRTGIVLAPEGGALGRVMPLLKAGLAGPLGGGDQWWPWITLADHIRIQLHLLDSDLTGPVNLAAPVEARQTEVLRTLADQANRPYGLPVPAVGLRAALGEFADDITASQRMHPRALAAGNYQFMHPTIESAAPWLVS